MLDDVFKRVAQGLVLNDSATVQDSLVCAMDERNQWSIPLSDEILALEVLGETMYGYVDLPSTRNISYRGVTRAVVKLYLVVLLGEKDRVGVFQWHEYGVNM